MTRTVFACTIAMLVLTAPALAQRGGGASHGSPAPKPQVAKPQPPKTQPPKVQSSKPTTMKPSRTTVAAKTTGKSSASASAKTTATSKRTPTSTSKTTTAPTTTTLTPVQQKLQRNSNLASKLQSRLPAGTDLQAAAAGFRNLGQFVAAVNVSNNLGIPFSALKTRMVDRGMSLGQAIQDARPATTDTAGVARRADSDADDLIRTTEPTVTKPKTARKPDGRK